MCVDISDIYKQMFDEHKFAAEYRVKIVIGWSAMYAALVTAFVWINSNHPSLSCVISVAAFIGTIIMRSADARNRPHIRAPRDIGMAIEQDTNAGIPENQRFFSSTGKEFLKIFRVGRMIDILSISLLLILDWVTWYLLYYKGAIPK